MWKWPNEVVDFEPDQRITWEPRRRDLAGSLNNLSNRLSDLGQTEEALAAIQEAAQTYRELAAARPDAFRPGLAWPSR